MKESTVYNNFVNDVIEKKCWRIIVNGKELRLSRSLVHQSIISLIALKAKGATHMSLPINSYTRSCVITLPIEEMEDLLYTVQIQKHNHIVNAVNLVIEDVNETIELEGGFIPVNNQEEPKSQARSVEKGKDVNEIDSGITAFVTSADALLSGNYELLTDKLRLDDFSVPEFKTENLQVVEVNT